MLAGLAAQIVGVAGVVAHTREPCHVFPSGAAGIRIFGGVEMDCVKLV